MVRWRRGQLAAAGDIMEAKQMSAADRDSGLVVGERAVGHFGFADGVLGEIHFLGYETLMGDNYGVDVLGSEGQLAVRASGSIDNGLWHLPRPMEGLPSALGDWQGVELGDVKGESPIATMYRRLAASMASGRQPPSSGAEGRTAFEMVLGIYQSHRQGGCRVDLPLVQRRHPLEVWAAQA